MSYYPAENFEQAKDEDLRIINKFVNKKIGGEEVWQFFTKTDDVSIFNVSIVHELLFSALKWYYEIIQQQPLDYEKVDEILRELREQIRIDKPNVFLNNMVQQMNFTNLLEYLRLMYAGGFVSDQGLLDGFTKSRFPNVPFPCQLTEKKEIKAWSQTLQKLTTNKINKMRGEIGNAIDWNKLNDTFLVDFKGVMYWFQKESIQAADEKAFSGASVPSLRSEAETTSLTNEAARSDARSGDGQKTPVSRDDSLPANYLPRGRRSFSVGLGQNSNTPPSSYNRSSSVSQNPIHNRYYSSSSHINHHHRSPYTTSTPHKPFSPPPSGSHRKYSDGSRFHSSRSFPTQNSPYHPLIEGEKYTNPSALEKKTHRHHPPHRPFQSPRKLNDQGFHVVQGNPPNFDKTPSPTPERQFRSHKLRSRTPERNILFPHKRNHQKQQTYNNLSPISLHNNNVHNNNSNFHHQKKYTPKEQGMDEILGGPLPEDDMSDFSEDIDINHQYFQTRTQELYSMGRRSRKRNPTESKNIPINTPPKNDLVFVGRKPQQIDAKNVINPMKVHNKNKIGIKNIRSRSACLSSDFPDKILTYLPHLGQKKFSDDVPQNIYFTEDKFRLREFFSKYGVPDSEILKMAGRKIHIEEWNAHQKRCLITLNGQKIWLPRDITVLPKEQLLGREKELRNNMSLTPILGEPLNLANNMPILNYDSQSVTLSIKEIKKKLTEQKEKQMRERKSSLGSSMVGLRERSLSSHSRYKNSRQHNRREHNLSNFSRQSSHLSYNRSRSLPEEKFTENNPVANISTYSHNNNPYSVPNLLTLVSPKEFFTPPNTEKNKNGFAATAASPTIKTTTTPNPPKNLQNVQKTNLEKNHTPPLPTLIIQGKPPPQNQNLISSSTNNIPNKMSSNFSQYHQNPQPPPPSPSLSEKQQPQSPINQYKHKKNRRSVSTPNENTPTSILKNPRKASVSSEKRTNFNLEPDLIPSPGIYFITRNRQLISKKCIIHRLDARRLIALMGRRVEITKINRDLIGTFENKERTYLIPMSCCNANR